MEARTIAGVRGLVACLCFLARNLLGILVRVGSLIRKFLLWYDQGL
jgi:hypothetical protein